MKKFTLLLFVIIAMVTIGHEKQIQDASSGKKKVTLSGQQNQNPDNIIPSFLENAITIKLKEGVGDFEKQTDVVNFGIQSLDEKVSMFEVHQLEKRFRYNPAKLKAGMPDLSRIYMIQFPAEHNVLHVAEIFSQDPNVEYAEPIPIDYPADIPNDELYHLCQHLPQIMAPEAWDIFHGEDGPQVVIAIVDNGVDWKHTDLALNIWQNLGEDANGNGRTLEFINGEWVFDPGDLNGIDDDGNGFVDDLIGWDMVLNKNNPNHNWGENHGTHCAGIAAGVTNNMDGISSISWNLKVMPLQVAQADGLFTEAYDGIIYAAENGADFISNSWSGSVYSQANQEVINYATELGSVILASAGNYNSLQKRYPASYAGALSIAAVSVNDVKTSYSSFGPAVDIAAPGGGTEGGILSTLPNNQYGRMSGTSMACPMVAGCFGLLKAYNPTWTAEQLITQVLGTADNIDTLNSNYIDLLGTGRVNAYRFMSEQNVQMPQKLKLEMIATSYVDANGNNINEPGELVTLNLQFRNYVPYVGENGVSVTLSSDDPDVTIITGTALVKIPPDGAFDINNQFVFQVGENASSHFAEFTVTFDAVAEIVYGAETSFGVLIAPSGIFIFEGVANELNYSGTFIRQVLDQLDIHYVYANEYPPTLMGFDHVFVSHANFGQNLNLGTMLTVQQAQMFQEFLQSGGNMFVDMSSMFGIMAYEVFPNYAQMKALFGVANNTIQMFANPIDSLFGMAGTVMADIYFTQSNQTQNWYIDKLTTLPEAVTPFFESNYGGVSAMFDGASTYGHKTFYMCYALAGLVDIDAIKSKNNVLLKVLDFFEILDDGYLLAAFKSNVLAGAAPLEVQFTDWSVFDAGFPIQTWQWDLDGDGIFDSQDQNPVWIYTQPGDYDVTLVITNALGSNTLTKTGMIRINEGCLVYEGKPAGEGYSGIFIKEFLEEHILLPVTYSNDFPTSMDGYEAVFLSYGNYGFENTVLDNDMADVVMNYLQNGGYVYIDGGDPLGWDQRHNSNLHDLFGLDSVADGISNPIDLLEGQQLSIANGITFTSSSQMAYEYIDIFVPYDQGQSAFIESDYGIVAVQNTGIFDQRTFCFSYSLADLNDGEEPNTRTELMIKICEFFDIPINTVSIENKFDDIVNLPGVITVYPNPITNQTVIKFNLPQTSTVSIQIFNAMGAKVAELHHGQLPAGQQQFRWDAVGLPKGSYFCRVQAGNEIMTRKILKQ
jgi:serine protease